MTPSSSSSTSSCPNVVSVIVPSPLSQISEVIDSPKISKLQVWHSSSGLFSSSLLLQELNNSNPAKNVLKAIFFVWLVFGCNLQ